MTTLWASNPTALPSKSSSHMPNCLVCGHTHAGPHILAREMMYGSRESFEYFVCARCECIQLKSVPKNLSDYYSERYYSFASDGLVREALGYIRGRALRAALGQPTLVGAIVRRIYRNPNAIKWVRPLNLTPASTILDVGSGSGTNARLLRAAGYLHVTAIDPYIPSASRSHQGLMIKKCSIHDVAGRYDVIMFHHSFEHMVDPVATLRAAAERLSPRGSILLRMPVAGTYAWRHYGTSWVQLDPPRHICVHSRKSIEMLADKLGLQVETVVFDSTEFQFWGSEQILRDIPIMAPESYGTRRSQSIFASKQMASFRRHANRLNDSQDGDQACFILRLLSEGQQRQADTTQESA